MSEKENDFQKIKKLIKIMKENDLIEVEIKHGEDKILLKRSGPQQPLTAVGLTGANIQFHEPGQTPLATEQQQAAGGAEEGLIEIKSPIVGTFYGLPSPDSESYVEVGSAVSPQTVVCIIEAMKVMNEIKAEVSGVIVEILITNGQAVEYGQPMFKVKPE